MSDDDSVLDVSVQIITLNEASDLGDCLSSVRSQGAVEILVIDGGSTDSTRDIATESGAEVILAPALGRGAARALGYQSTARTYVAMVDADDRLPAGWLKALLAELETGGYAALQGSLRVKDPSNFWERGWNEYFTEAIQPRAESAMVGHPAIYTRRDLVETLGHIGHDHEDTQLSMLYEQRNLRQGISATQSYRTVETSWVANRRKWIAYGRGYRSLVDRYPEKRSAIIRHLFWTIPFSRGWRPVFRGHVLQPAFAAVMATSIIWGFFRE